MNIMSLDNRHTSTFQRRSFFVSVLFIAQITNALNEGDACGEPLGSKRYMQNENGNLVCSLCRNEEFWDNPNKRCRTCTGSMTNLSPNVLTSCNDPRPRQDVNLTWSTSQPTNIALPTHDDEKKLATKNTSAIRPEAKVQNVTNTSALANLTTASNNTDKNEIPNTIDRVYTIPISNNDTNELDDTTREVPCLKSNETTDGITQEKNVWKNIAIVLGVILLICLIVFLVYKCWKRRLSSRTGKKRSHQETSNTLPVGTEGNALLQGTSRYVASYKKTNHVLLNDHKVEIYT